MILEWVGRLWGDYQVVVDADLCGGIAIANAYTALEAGATHIDTCS